MGTFFDSRYSYKSEKSPIVKILPIFYIFIIGFIGYFIYNAFNKEKVVMVEGIEVETTEVSLSYGQQKKIKANVVPKNASKKKIEWTSSDYDFVSVDNNGNLYVLENKDGEVIITAKTTEGNYSKDIKVTVLRADTVIPVEGINIEKEEISLKYNETYKINVNILPENATNKIVLWESSDSSLVSVDTEGNIKVQKNITNEAFITATTKEGNYSKKIKVNTVKVESNNNSNTKPNNGGVNTKPDNNNTGTKVIKVSGVKINGDASSTVYINNSNYIPLTATVSPNDATNKSVTWSSDNTNVATVDNNGKVTLKGVGVANIKVITNDGNFMSSYKLTVRQKNIIVITASLGSRMNNWFTSYNSSSGYNFNTNNGTIKYIYKDGTGFEYQYKDGLNSATNYLNEKYSNNKDKIDLYLYFSLTGNSVKSYTCDNINNSQEYVKIANEYNSAVQKIINLGYKNTKGYIISHSPLNSKHSLASKYDIVYSTNEKACSSGYRSAWKYYLSNQRMINVLKNGDYNNIKFIDNFSKFLIVKDHNKKTFTWLRAYTTPDNDALHWDEPTTKEFMKLVFDSVNM